MTPAEPTICLICRKGHVIIRKEEIAFRQWSDKGYINCRVTIPIATCNHCETRYSPDPEIDKILDEAFQREYEKW
jgi:hypothetical protein